MSVLCRQPRRLACSTRRGGRKDDRAPPPEVFSVERWVPVALSFGQRSVYHFAPLPSCCSRATVLRSGDFGSPVLGWSHLHKGEGAGTPFFIDTATTVAL